MDLYLQTKSRKSKYKNISPDNILNVKLRNFKFLDYSITDEAGIGLKYTLVCHESQVSERIKKIGTLELILIGKGERAKINISLYEETNNKGDKQLKLSYEGPLDRYLNLEENVIVSESLKMGISEICGKLLNEDAKRISLKIIYRRNKMYCEHTDGKYKERIYDLLLYIGCALKSREISELIYEKLNLDECRETKEKNSNSTKESEDSSTIYIV